MCAPNLVTNHYPIFHLGDFFCHMAPVPSPICHMFTQQLRFFTNFIKFSSFSHMCTPVVVSTTHPGLPSPPTIDWPPIPPAYWPSATFWPTSHRFLLISHPIRSVWVWQTPHWTPSTCLHSMHSSIHLSIHPSIHLSGPILSGLHALLCPSVPISVHCHHCV